MPNLLLSSLILLLAPQGAAAASQELDGVELAQLTIRQRIVIRLTPQVSRTPSMPIPIPRDVPMDEKKGPKCVPIGALAGSAVARRDSVDLTLVDGTMVRAKLEDHCPALDFYTGFYLKPTPDGDLCANRDVIRARSGRACAIASFKALSRKR